VVDGLNVSVTVRRGELVIEDGIGRARRTRKIPRADARAQQPPGVSDDWGLARLVILGNTGYVSLEALHWCADLGVAVVHIDRDGRLLMSSPGQSGDARIRETQVYAQPGGMFAETGMRIIKDLMTVKMNGQAEIMREMFRADVQADRIAAQVKRMLMTDSYVHMLSAEGQAANAYWKTWVGSVRPPFSPTSLKNVPVHWMNFSARLSKNLRTARNASDPINAMLNYAYKICESEARLACHIAGLEPMYGLAHDHSSADHGMVHDLMESVRPDADRAVLAMLDYGSGMPIGDDGRPLYFDVKWFSETTDGTCRLVAPLTHMLAERVVPAVAGKLAGHADTVHRELGHASRYVVGNVRPAPSDVRVRAVTRPVFLDGSLTGADLIPDDVWARVRPLIPPEPRPRMKKPTPRADDRAVLAGIICHEVHRVPWMRIPVGLGVGKHTARRRFEEWSNAGVWPAILAEVTR
jgi:CRISPR-associated endonuclease Cas1